MRVILDYVKEETEFDKVTARILRDNERSKALALSMGLLYEKEIVERGHRTELYSIVFSQVHK